LLFCAQPSRAEPSRAEMGQAELSGLVSHSLHISQGSDCNVFGCPSPSADRQSMIARYVNLRSGNLLRSLCSWCLSSSRSSAQLVCSLSKLIAY
jgi:hypothetical protein